MEEFHPPIPNADTIPVADVTEEGAPGRVEYEAYPVRKPEEDLNDFRIQVRASTLARCRTKLAKISASVFPWHEICLGISTLAAGGYLGSLTSSTITSGSLQAIFFFNILPIIAVGTFIAYFFLRQSKIKEPSEVAVEVLAELPDPEKTR